MTDGHVGFSITPKVDLSGFDKAVQLSNRFEEKLSKIDQGLSRLHAPSSLPREINHIDTVTASYVQRLESEGKHYQATQERVKAYKNAIQELSDKQKGLEHLLETSSQGIDKNSDSYRRLQIRANQNATVINKFKDAVKQTNSEMRSTNPTFMDHIKSKLNGLQEKAEATHRSFKDIFMGSALGNMASNALGNLSGQFSGAIKRGMELNGAVGKINSRFKAMGANDKEVGALDKQISSLKYNTNMTGDNVANLQARMQNWSRIGKHGAMQMTTAIAGIGDSSKMTGDDIERMSTGLMRVGASGKVTLSSLNRITRTAPTFYAQLAKGAGMSQSHLKALLATGKVTQNQFQTWLADSAKYSSTAFKAFGKTQGGAIHQIKVRWDTVKTQLTKPLFDAKSSGLQSLKSILTSKEVTSGANAVGHAIANTVGYLDKHKQDISGIARDVVKIGVEIGKSVWKDFSGIVMDVGHALGIIHGHGSALHQFKTTLDGIAKNKQEIQSISKAIIAIAAIKGFTHVGSGLLGIGLNAYGAYRKVKVFHDGLHGIQTVGKLTKAEEAFNSLGISISGVIGKLAKMKAAGQTLGGTGGKIFGAVGTGLIAGQQGVQAIKDRHNASARSKDIGGGIGAVAGGALTSMIPVVGPMLAPVGALIGKYAGRWGGQAVNNFTKGWQAKKPPKKFWSMAHFGWLTHDTLNKIGKWGGQVGKKFGTAISKGKRFFKKNEKELALTAVSPLLGIPALLYKNNPKFRKAANSVFNHVKAGWNGAKAWASKLGRDTSRNIKNGWNGMRTWASKRLKDVQSGWKGATSWFGDISSKSNKWFKSKWRGIDSWSKGIYKGFQSGWNGLKNWLGDLAKGAVDLFKKPFEGLSSWVNQHIPKPVRDVAGKIGNGAKSLWNKVTVKAHAKGGLMLNNHSALVGEAGPELAYKPYARHVRLLGANGPEFTKVHSGEHILNAIDTAKVMSGGLGQGYQLKGYASGTGKLSKTIKTVSSDYKKITDNATKSLKQLTRNNSSGWSKIKSGATKQVTRLARTNNYTWTLITKQTNKQTDRTRRDTISDYTNIRKGVNKQTDRTRHDAVSDYTGMRKGVNKQMNNLHDGVIKLAGTTSKGFGKELGRMKGYAHSAMSDTIGQVNKGISGIDKVLGQFGGNTSVIKPVKFATGTDANGRLTQNTYAMVNDATSGPRQEALVSDKNEIFMPRGSNVTMMIPRGWGVLNGKQTQQAGLQYFAKGSNLSHSVLRKLAEKAGANPVQSFKDMFLSHLKPDKTDFGRGSTNLASNSGKHFGNPWSAAMWSVINNAIGDSSKNAKGLLKAVEKSGEGHRYVWGAAGPSTFDCSGLVMYALKHDYGIDYPHFSGAQYARTRHISKNQARMGDLVFWGAGGSDHVGVYAGGNQYFSAESPSQGIHMNTLNSVVGKGSPMFGRIKGIVAPSAKHKDKVDSRLIRLAKHELGFSALKWIKDNLGDYGSLANPSGDGVARWRKVIERAASAMHVSLSKADLAHILNVTAHESGGDARSVNRWDSNAKAGIPSKGVVQFIQPTFDHYAVKGHHNILNGYDQYLAMFNDKTWRRDLTLGGWGPSGPVRGYANGGNPRVGDTVMVGENGPELAKFNSPVHVYSNEQSRKLDFTDLLNRKPVKQTNSSQPVINININGNISSMAEANRVSDIVARKIEQVLDGIADNWGTEPDAY